MARLQQVILAVLLTGLIFTFGCGNNEEVVEETAQLFKIGDWMLYDLNRINVDGTETQGTLKVAAVGQELIEGQAYFWLEMREDSAEGVKITKILAREKPLYNPDDGFTFWDDVKRIIVQEDTNQPEEVPSQHLRRFIPHFIEGSGAKRFGNVEDLDPPERSVLPEKTFEVSETTIGATGIRSVQHFTSSVNLGFLNLEDTTESSVEYYRSTELPFGGIISVNFVSKTTSVNKLKPDAPPKPPQNYSNSMELKAFGTGAESQIIGTPRDMEVMPFPFLEAARKNADK